MNAYAITHYDAMGGYINAGVILRDSPQAVAAELYGDTSGDRHEYTPEPERLTISGQWGRVTIERV